MSQTTIPRGQIAVGDCINQMARWPADSVDLVFADPPYNIGFQYDHYQDNRPGDEYVQWTEDWVDACARLLKPTGSLYILIGDEYAAETRLHLKRLEADGKLLFRNWIIWHYTFGQNTKVMFNRSHAHLFYCVGSAALSQHRKGGKAGRETVFRPRSDLVKNPPFTFNREAIAVPSARQTTYADARANPAGKAPDDTWALKPEHEQPALFADQGDDEAAPPGGNGHDRGPDHAHWILRPQEAETSHFGSEGDTWYLSRLCGTFKERLGWHPCQLPEALLERIVKVSSNPGDLVFDPFVGSGTTLAVAARLGRDWLGCELSPDYADKARERIRYTERTGRTMQVDNQAKGIERGKPKKKAERKKSAHLARTSRGGRSGA
jgi:site-specific DNA-methyltransferase (adenine-specific)